VLYIVKSDVPIFMILAAWLLAAAAALIALRFDGTQNNPKQT
jgi:hypothetical protein